VFRLNRSNTGAIDGCEQRGTIVGWHPGAWRSGTSVLARKNITLMRTRILRVTQPRALVRPKATRRALRAVAPPRMFTRTPRMPAPASVRQAVTLAKVRFPRRCRLAVTASWVGSRTSDVLWAALAWFGTAEPGVYGMKTPFQGYEPRVPGFVNTLRTENAATTSEAPDGAPCGAFVRTRTRPRGPP
jgi:hypothetical protein